jgi:hypothetical protein
MVALSSVGLAACGSGGGSEPGDVTGQGLTVFGAAWFALSPFGSASGKAVTASSSNTGVSNGC